MDMPARFRQFVQSRRFLYAVLAFFVFESVWVAFSARYPMAFDEDFHLGIIKIYSHHWLPFLSGQPPNAGAYGAVARDPSYLYHYLMSFPYRLLTVCIHSETVQVVSLRLINVALFGAGLVLFYKLFRRVGVSPALANVTLTLLVLIPIVPLLAGQINYDNLLLPLVAWVCLLTNEVRRQFRAGAISIKTLILLGVVCLLTSLVKYAFLPIFAAVVCYVLWEGWRAFRSSRSLLPAVRRAYRATSVRAKIGLVVALALALGLFVQRYGMNVVAYHQPIPDCAVVLSEDECMSYGPWARDYQYSTTKHDFTPNPIGYTWQWLEGLHYRLFFMISGPTNGNVNYPPLPFPAAAFAVIAVSGFVALVLAWRVLRRNSFIVFLLLAALLYLIALWAEDYREYAQTGAAVAVNGRYLLPIMLPIGAVLGCAFSQVLAALPRIKVIAVACALLLFLQGGGLLSFVVRSDTSWYWPNRVVRNVNNAAHAIVNPFVFKGGTYF